MSTTTKKLTLNFFGEIVTIDQPQSLEALRKDISRLYCFSPEDAKEIILTYNENGDIVMIQNDEDLKVFINSKNNQIDLDISQNSKIYQKNLENIKEENEKDKKDLELLLKKNEELDKIKQTQFAKDKEEMHKIREEIKKLSQKRHEIRKKVMQGIKKINLEKRENEIKIVEIQKKLGIPITINTKKHDEKDKLFRHKMHKIMLQKRKKNHICHLGLFKPPFMTKRNNENIDIKNKTMEEWRKFLLDKTQEITTKLSNTFKDINLFNMNMPPLNTENKKEKSKSKEKKEIHFNVRCDGCNMYPLIGKRFKCKECPNFDFCEKCLEKNKESHKHEFIQINQKDKKDKFPKKHHHIHHLKKQLREEKKVEEQEKKEELKLSDKIVHFGIKCDGCGKFPIIGCRYKCVICNDFDFCEECEKEKGEEHNHPFMKIYEPKMAHLTKFNKEKK